MNLQKLSHHEKQLLCHMLDLLTSRQRERLIKLIQTEVEVDPSKIQTPIDDTLSGYIKTQIHTINGIDYLIDEHNILFDHNETNIIVGRRLADGQYEWF